MMDFGCRTLAPTALVALLASAAPARAQLTGLENGEWHYLGGDAGHTRSNPSLTQITAENFADLEVAWIFRGDNFGPIAEITARSTPVYADGLLYTVFGGRRQVVAIDPATGETPSDHRWAAGLQAVLPGSGRLRHEHIRIVAGVGAAMDPTIPVGSIDYARMVSAADALSHRATLPISAA